MYPNTVTSQPRRRWGILDSCHASFMRSFALSSPSPASRPSLSEKLHTRICIESRQLNHCQFHGHLT